MAARRHPTLDSDAPQPGPAIPDLRDALQRTLGGAYTIERELGGGGMSRVFLAEEIALGRRVVIKVLPPELTHAVSGERFRQEIRLAARLHHPHIVPLLTAGESDGVPYYTMPYVEGESLRARLTQAAIPLTEAVSILRDVVRALAYAHEHGVVHRDIKPENILLTNGTAAVTDFGVAKAVSAATSLPHGSFTSLGVVLGTPAYMAPEQAAADPTTDHRADIYAFGCLAYEVLAGSPPFATHPAPSLLAAHAIERPVPITERRPELPRGLAELVMRCLEKRPADRPGSAAELLAGLDGGEVRRGSPRRRMAVVGGAVVALAGLAVVFGPGRLSRPDGAVPPEPAALHAVAVLPFVNTGGDPSDEYFSDGMTDELAHALAALPGIRVAGRTSSYAYKGKAATVQEIGRTLGVGGVIAGSVRRAGDRIRVTVQLSSAADGFQRWSHEYERRAADVFELQDELTRAIVTELEPELRGRAADVAGERRGTADAAAYEHYLRGRYFFVRRGLPGLTKAIEEYRIAIARDSAFARAWAGLALVYVILPSYEQLDADSSFRLGIAYARRALALDSTLAEAHLAVANALASQVELSAADAEFRRVLELMPNDPTAHLWYSAALQAQGRVDDALETSRRATELDPLSAVIWTDRATVLLSAGRYADALSAGRRALDLDSTFTFARTILAQIHGVTGRTDSALVQLGLAPPGRPEDAWRGPGWRGMAAWAYGLAGRRADVARMRADIAAQSGGGTGYDAGMAALAAGDLEAAVAGIERSLERHELFNMEAVPGCTPVFDPLKPLPSFRALMNRHGIHICEPSAAVR